MPISHRPPHGPSRARSSPWPGVRRNDSLPSSTGLEVRKLQLDQEVAFQLGTSRKVVSAVTAVFLHVVSMRLLEMHGVRLDGFGTLTIGAREGKIDSLRTGTFRPGESNKSITVKSRRKVYITFKKARRFAAEIRARYGGAVSE